MVTPHSSIAASGDDDDSDAASQARDRLLEKITAQSDLPALGASVSKVVQMTSSDDEAVRNLAHFILADVALTQKILRIANSVTYRNASSTPVTTVSKAIFMLGFETVKTCALAMLLVDRMSTRQARNVRNELAHALCASIVGREMARRGPYKDAEEAAIASLFKNIGRVLVAAHEHECFVEISRLVEAGRHTPAQASHQILGCSFDTLGEAVLREWNIPDPIVAAMIAPPAGVLKPARSRQEWVQQVAAFSAASARLIPGMSDPGQEAALKAVLTRFGGALGLDQGRLLQLYAQVSQESRTLLSTTGLQGGRDNELAAADAEAGGTHQASSPRNAGRDGFGDVLGDYVLEATGASAALAVTHRYPSGKPLNARDLLLAGVQDVTQMMSSGRWRANDLILLVLETLYTSMGFRFATVCLKDLQSGQFRSRIALGESREAYQSGFAFPAAPTRDLFHLAMENDADLMISDARVPKIRDLLPSWHRLLLPDARSFIVLPLVVQKRQLGLFYADRVEAAPEGVPPDETALIKTLKGQVLTALNAR
ncbi:MAG TPA: HDOD domain-containing protein [Noviherbaspirillum sp.]|nr:HDOD domain-containing protein [Noviherbaspirillum sp.]